MQNKAYTVCLLIPVADFKKIPDYSPDRNKYYEDYLYCNKNFKNIAMEFYCCYP